MKVLEAQWEKEKTLVAEIRTLQTQLEEADSKKVPAPDGAHARLKELEKQLIDMQGETGMMRVAVDAQIVGEVISAWTGIPLGKMMKDEIATVLTLDEHLKRRVIGQDHALVGHRAAHHHLARQHGRSGQAGRRVHAGRSQRRRQDRDCDRAGRPAVRRRKNMITINMSEFQEAHTVSTLKGSPPGYVGYGEGGVLTEAVRRRPYSVVLLDEVEKAHPDVLELFFQVFDKGRMEDGEGREIDFRNTIIILTSNAATDTLMKLTADPETMPNEDGSAGGDEAGAEQDLQAGIPGPHDDRARTSRSATRT